MVADETIGAFPNQRISPQLLQTLTCRDRPLEPQQYARKNV